jgi:hypothetical protein
MSCGIKDISKVTKDEAIVKCNWCDNFFYEEITDERNDNSLSFVWDFNGYFFKGCPECKTDDYLKDVSLNL